MKIVREAGFDEVQRRFQEENRGSQSFNWTNDRLSELRDQEWKYVLLGNSDVEGVLLPSHSHGWVLQSGSTVLTAAQRIPRQGSCWENVVSHRDRDYTSAHVFLKCEENRLHHIDGFHRLLAWVIFEKEHEVPAYIVAIGGEMDHQATTERLAKLQQKVLEGAELTPEEREEAAHALDIVEKEETEQDTRPTSQASGKSNAPIIPPHPKDCTCISCDMKRGT
jgi:hypothetical protein